MRRILALTILAAAVLAQSVSGAAAQDVRNTSYVTKSGERVLRIETFVPVSTEDVWKVWTAPQELSKWIAPVVAIDLRIGGTISTNYDQKAAIGNPGTIPLPIINYIEKQLITLKVNLNDKFPKKVRDEDHDLQDFVSRHRIDNRRRNEMGEKFFDGECRDLQAGRLASSRHRSREIGAGLQPIDHN